MPGVDRMISSKEYMSIGSILQSKSFPSLNNRIEKRLAIAWYSMRHRHRADPR